MPTGSQIPETGRSLSVATGSTLSAHEMELLRWADQNIALGGLILAAQSVLNHARVMRKGKHNEYPERQVPEHDIEDLQRAVTAGKRAMSNNEVSR